MLENAIAKLNFPMLAGNIAKADGSSLPGTQASSMVEIDDFKIGIFGLTSPETAFKSSPGDYGFALASKLLMPWPQDCALMVQTLLSHWCT